METSGARAKRRDVLLWAVVFVAVAALAAAPGIVSDNESATALRLVDLPREVSAIQLDGEDLFVMREGRDVRVFLSDPRHLPGDTLWWCPNEQLFVEVEHGSMFDRKGRKMGGPARGGLNQYRVRLDDDKLIVDRSEVVVGGLTPRGESPSALDDADFSRPYNSGPGSFCDDPVASPPEAAPKGDPDVTIGGGH